MSKVPELNNAAINMAALRDFDRKEFLSLLDGVHGKKALVLDPSLSGPLGLIIEFPLLKEHGVENVHHLASEKLTTDQRNIIYLVRPKIPLMKLIARQVHDFLRTQQKREFYLVFVPRRKMICEHVLEEEGVFADLKIREYGLGLLPLDNDVLSLELEGSFRECFLDGDRSALYYVARSLMKLQTSFGFFPSIKGKGALAKTVVEMLLRMRKEGGEEERHLAPEIDTLVVLDRSVDYVTPLCTQLTYEGLVDEVFSITNGCVDLDADLVATDDKEKKTGKIKTAFNSNDKLFSEIRDLSFSVLGPFLNKKAKYIDENYKKRHAAHTVNELRDFVKKLGPLQQEHQMLRIHTNVAERILQVTKERDFHSRLESEQSLLVGGEIEISNNYIEECIYRKDPLLKILRLICLQSLTSGGIKPPKFDFWRTEIIEAYGYRYLSTLYNLEKLALFRRQEGRAANPFDLLRKGLRLIVEDIDENNPTDIAYIYALYAPLSIRLVEEAVKADDEGPRISLAGYNYNFPTKGLSSMVGSSGVSNWKAQDEVLLKNIPGPTFEEKQKVPQGALSDGKQKTSLTLVFFIGGVTFSEISALRFLAQEGRRDFIIATTKIINGDSFLKELE